MKMVSVIYCIRPYLKSCEWECLCHTFGVRGPKSFDVKILCLTRYFNTWEVVLPHRLLSLEVRGFHGNPTDWKLPETLLCLRIGDKFHGGLGQWHLPSGLMRLAVGVSCTDFTGVKLPLGLTRLKLLGCTSIKDLPNLPTRLQRLCLKDAPDLHQFCDWRKHQFCDCTDVFPQSLRRLTIKGFCTWDRRVPFPKHIEYFTVQHLSLMPHTLLPDYLDFSSIRRLIIEYTNLNLLECFPQNPKLNELVILSDGLWSMSLPQTITRLLCSFDINDDNRTMPPKGLTHFHVRSITCPISAVYFPDSLTHLSIGYVADNIHEQRWILPPKLIYLKLGPEFNSGVNRWKLPKTLKHLEFGTEFNQPVDSLKLPFELETLIFGSKFDKMITKLPHSLRYLRCFGAFTKKHFTLPSGMMWVNENTAVGKQIPDITSYWRDFTRYKYE